MLVCLETRGYIARSSGDERYSLTLHLFKLAYQHPPIERLTTEAVPIMRHVTDQINQSCHLGVIDGVSVCFSACSATRVAMPNSTRWQSGSIPPRRGARQLR